MYDSKLVAKHALLEENPIARDRGKSGPRTVDNKGASFLTDCRFSSHRKKKTMLSQAMAATMTRAARSYSDVANVDHSPMSVYLSVLRALQRVISR
jgi:hypothetical protein